MTLGGVPRGILVLGGTSEIALAVTGRWIALGTRQVILAGRDQRRLREAAETLSREGVDVVPMAFDAMAYETHHEFVDTVFRRHAVDTALIAFGLLGDQKRDETEPASAGQVVSTNYVGGVTIGLAVARRFADQGHGTIVIMSSVAGERARADNFIYGSSKAGLDAFAEGLSHRYHADGVTVTTVRPGFVRGTMTHGRPPAPFATEPETVARYVVRGVARGAAVIWVPGKLRWIMKVFRLLPRSLVRRLSR